MLRSHFRLLPIMLICTVFISITAVTFFLAKVENISNNIPAILYIIFFVAFFIYFTCLLFFGELRTKAIVVIINDQAIIKKGFIGLGVKKIYAINDLSGFKISLLHSGSGTYEYLYLMLGNKKVIKLSEYYHKNYKELKQLLVRKNVKNLGVEYWSFMTETKELFQ
jgi:hypothetical protein